jgi:choice-of-anchor A domain-containing protein
MFRKMMLGAAGALTFAQPLIAAPITGQAALNEWNLIVLGDLATTSNVEGRTFVGGSITNQNSADFNKNQTVSGRGQPGLTVVGNVAGNAKNLWGGAAVGGNVTSAFNLNGPLQTVRVGGTIPLVNINGNTVKSGLNNAASPNYDPSFLPGLQAQRDALSTSLLSLSDYLKTLNATPGTATVSIAHNRATFNAVGTGLNVINLAGSQLATFGEISFANAGTTVINVSGSNLLLNDNFLGGGPQNLGENVIWNFHEATNLTFTTSFYGSVLAPRAHGTIGNFIDGSVAFASMTQNGEVHLGTFRGSIPDVAAVPEPASWAMMILGFGMLGGAMRRQARLQPRLA